MAQGEAWQNAEMAAASSSWSPLERTVSAFVQAEESSGRWEMPACATAAFSEATVIDHLQ